MVWLNAGVACSLCVCILFFNNYLYVFFIRCWSRCGEGMRCCLDGRTVHRGRSNKAKAVEPTDVRLWPTLIPRLNPVYSPVSLYEYSLSRFN